MLSPNVQTKPLGFSLIELLVGMAVIGILLSVALPSFRVWIQNAQIRTAAESIQNGLQRARAEALARNTTVLFFLQPEAPNNNTSWNVFVTGIVDPIETRLSSEGTATVKRAVLPAGANTVVFDNTGRPAGPNDITSITLDSDVLDAAESKELQVTVNFGGTIRMCDPNVAHPNPRAC